MTGRGWLAAAVAALVGGGSLWFGTDGFRAFTAESARRLAVREEPRALPPAHFEDQDGRVFGWDAYTGSILLVDFIYTSCPTLCPVLGDTFAEIVAGLPEGAYGRDVFLLSVSFDAEHDTPEYLDAYGRRYAADGTGWRLARIADPVELSRVLDAFGIVVIPMGSGEFEHNAAVHLVGRDGRLARIYDHDAAEGVVADLQNLL